MEQIIWIGLGAILLSMVISAIVKAPGQNLSSKFVALGELKGKTKDEIISAVGPPNSISALAENQTVCQWMAGVTGRPRTDDQRFRG